MSVCRISNRGIIMSSCDVVTKGIRQRIKTHTTFFGFPLFEHATGDMFEVTRTVVLNHTCGEMNIYRTS